MGRWWTVRSLAAAWLSAALLVASTTRADSPSDTAAAEVLFQEGQRLFDEGDLARACPKFAASYDLDPGLGTLLNLARCYEEAGKTASAWVAYVDLAPLAARAGQADRAGIAEERIAALAPRLVKLSLRVPAAETIAVTLDGEALAPALFGSALPVDPGEHVIAASRPGRSPYWSRTVALVEPGTTTEVVVEPPPPTPAPRPAPTAPAPAPMAPPPRAPLPPPADASASTPWLVAGGVVGGAGLVLLGVGGGFTADAASAWSDAGCSGGLCPDVAAQARSEQAGRSADAATGLMTAGGILAAAGTVLLLVGLTTSDQAAVGLGPMGLRGRF